MAKYGEFKYGEAKYGVAQGYVLFLRVGVAPVAGVDTPVATLSDSADVAALDMAALALLADTDYRGAIVPFNETGYADPPAEFALRTDALGNPSIRPAAVTNFRAEALAGGKVKITWNYDEPNPLAVAESFLVKADTDPLAFAVPRVHLQREYHYQHKGALEGLRTMSVTAARAGGSSATVTATVRTDATPPAATALAISAA